jgi:hypothetical protein
VIKIAPWPETEADAIPHAIARHYLVQASHDISWMGDPDQSKDPKDTAIRAGRVNILVYLAHALITLNYVNPAEATRLAGRIWQVATDGELRQIRAGDTTRKE